VVFCARYLDLFTSFYSVYNSFLKIFFIIGTAAIIYVIRRVEPAKSTYNEAQDKTLPSKITVPSILALAFVITCLGSGTVDITADEAFEVHFASNRFNVLEYLWTFSILLEPLAMVPQLDMFRKNRSTNINVRMAILLMGLYRLLYIVNWIHRAYTERGYRHHLLVYFAGVVQVLMYSDFVLWHIQYFTAWATAESVEPSYQLLEDEPENELLVDHSAESELAPTDIQADGSATRDTERLVFV